MKQLSVLLRAHQTTGAEGLHRPRRLVASALCLCLAASLLQGCVMAPITLVGSTTAAALVREMEMAVMAGDTSALVAVNREAVVYSGPGKQYPAVDTLNEGVEIEVVKGDGEWIECRSRRFDCGWVHVSAVRDI